MAEEKSKSETKDESKKDGEPSDRPAQPISATEWLIAAVGLILVLGTIGTALYRAVGIAPTAPRLSVVGEPPEPNGDGFLVRFSVENGGSQTAAAVSIEGELKNGAETVETAAATLTYAPGKSVRRGGLYFTKNPKDFQLSIRAVGYEEP